MRVAVIGTGNIGGSLGVRWRAAGHDVAFGGRTTSADGPGGMPVRDVAGAEVNCRSAVTSSAPGASYARAFSTLGWENFVEPPAGAALLFAADPAARPAVTELISATGIEPEYVGDGSAAGIVDGLLPLWFALVQQSAGNRKLAFSVVR